MPSIKQNPQGRRLPDFRNLGVMLRLLVGVNLMALAAALVQVPDLAQWLPRYVEMAVWVEPPLLCSLLLLALLRDFLWRLPYGVAAILACTMVAVQAALLADFWRFMGFLDAGWLILLRAATLGGGAAAVMLGYFHLRDSALSPAVAEARLQALTARIRPHFLFNSLNAVLSLIRADPRRAETALEELAELFRALMRDHRELVPLADELALCRQYLDLEKLRLAERLQVEWQLADNLPLELKVPPLMVQPLLENAVYHGIEPAGDGGTIRIRLARRGDELHVELANPCGGGSDHPRGNHMALDNIRERLALYYDLEARLETGEVRLADGRREYRVRIVLPCHRHFPRAR